MSLVIATPGGSAQFLSGNVLGDGIIAPGLAGAVNNFAPDNVRGSTLISMRPNAAVSISGMQAAPAFTMRWLKNDENYLVTLTDQDLASVAANRFNCYGASITLAYGQTAGFIYNGLTSRWDLFTVSGNGAAPPVTGLVTFGPEDTFVLLAGDNDNLTPAAGIANINRLLLDASAGDAVVTGIAAGADGQALLVTSINSANNIDLPNEDAGSLATNQLYGVGATIIQRGSQLLVYSGSLSRWVAR